MECLFCKIVKEKAKLVAEKEIYLVEENEKVIAILDKFPASDGHTLLITKKHFANLSEVDEESWQYLSPLTKKIIKKLETVFKPQGFNFISNMNKDMKKKIAYQSIPHFHLHIIPKYEQGKGFIWTVVNQDKKYNLEQVAEKMK